MQQFDPRSFSPAHARIVELEAELSETKALLATATLKANLVHPLLSMVSELANHVYVPGTMAGPTESHPTLEALRQQLMDAASRLGPQRGGSAQHSAPARTQVGGGLAQGNDDVKTTAVVPRKRKSEGGTTGRGAPGQKRHCPICRDADGNPMPLAGNHNASCPWCKKCWFHKRQVLKSECTEHHHKGEAGAQGEEDQAQPQPEEGLQNGMQLPVQPQAMPHPQSLQLVPHQPQAQQQPQLQPQPQQQQQQLPHVVPLPAPGFTGGLQFAFAAPAPRPELQQSQAAAMQARSQAEMQGPLPSMPGAPA